LWQILIDCYAIDSLGRRHRKRGQREQHSSDHPAHELAKQSGARTPSRARRAMRWRRAWRADCGF
jgi:hypothetical protein